MKDKKKQEKEKYQFPYQQEIEKFRAKHRKLISFVTEEEIKKFFEEAVSEYRPDSGLSDEIFVALTADRKFLTRLKALILDGNIDLEIAVLEQYSKISTMLVRKLNYRGDDVNSVAETGIINAIESYNGTDSMNSAILKELKNIIKGKNKKETNIPTEEPEKIEKVEEKPNALLIPKDDKKRPPTTLEQLLHDIDILKNSPLEDDCYIQFLSLKYGYHEGQYFSIEEITTILSISPAVANNYYLQSLQYIKDWFGYQLDKFYTYQLKANEN